MRAGFDPTRKVIVDASVPPDHPAHRLLEIMDGLHVGVGPGGTMLDEVRNDIAFGLTDRYGYISEWELLLNTNLVPVAETHHRHGMLYLSDDDRFFTLSGMHDAMAFNGHGLSDAVDNLLFGESRPMIRPDQDHVSWHGIKYRDGDHGLYRYDLVDPLRNG